MTALFDPFMLKSVTLRNRIGISPMCQYMAQDGMMNDWHLAHLGARAIGGAGLIIAEATAVSPEGRITPQCVGLWHDGQTEPLARAAAFIKAQGAVPGIQLAHAGRKASSNQPWVEGGAQFASDDPRGWQPISASPLPFGGNTPIVPREMDLSDIRRVQADFAAAARRAQDAGFEWLEIHYGHGYLGQNFLSPLSNRRSDAYGGDAEGRSRFLIETIDAVRAVWPDHLPLTVRLGVTDFVPEGHDVPESIALCRTMAAHGVDLIDVTIGFNKPDVSALPWGPAFMAPIAGEIRAAAQMPVAVSWMINDPAQADAIVRSEQADLILLARASLADPHWPYHAAKALGVHGPEQLLPVQTGDWLKSRGM